MIFGFHPLEGGYDVPMRVVGANIPYEWLIYVIMLIPVSVFLFGFWKKLEVWLLAKGEIHRMIKLHSAFGPGLFSPLPGPGNKENHWQAGCTPSCFGDSWFYSWLRA